MNGRDNKAVLVSISQRARRMPTSPIRKLMVYADDAKARGVHVHHLNIGQPDVHTPRGMIQAYQAYSEAVLPYGPTQGLPVLREALAAYYTGLGLSIDAEAVNVTQGGSEALQFAIAASADPDDELLVPEPFYANYAGFATGLGVRLVPISTSAENGFHLPPEADIEAKIGPKTKGIMITSPGNPTGTVYTRAEMEMLGRLVKKHNLVLISDEVYREFAYGGVKATSALSLKGVDDRVIVVDSVSKRFSACGARVGFLICRNADMNEFFMRMCLARLCPGTVDQLAAVEALKAPASYLKEAVSEYENRRDTLIDGLNSIDGISTYRPEGAFYAVVKFPVQDAEAFATWLLKDFAHKNETVMMAPAQGFYLSPGRGQQETRIAYVRNCDELVRSIEVLRAALSVYPS